MNASFGARVKLSGACVLWRHSPQNLRRLDAVCVFTAERLAQFRTRTENGAILGVIGCSFGGKTHKTFPFGKVFAIQAYSAIKIPDREILLALSPVLADNFPNGKPIEP
jgi:hypothetical protein